MREIILPPHLYDRIKASAGEHGGIGVGSLFEPGTTRGVPLCAHGHAWGTDTRYQRGRKANGDRDFCKLGAEPELALYLTVAENDNALPCLNSIGCGKAADRIPFARWCELLNVKRGVEVPAQEPELVSVA